MTILKSFLLLFCKDLCRVFNSACAPTAVIAALGPLQFTSAPSENIKL